ncbi:hypothetical protein [Xanthovirga aplysinae]|uniref:hypothetical protein n=1 Tax=Xanthovirga aplysinae TaxID=2529853 RepID=UPI0012BD5C18|nr:hypothetical protein [Xanthovirga aplysinae]MTI29308.1 hypothetical protein [Xanthovirga aplysinae]
MNRIDIMLVFVVNVSLSNFLKTVIRLELIQGVLVFNDFRRRNSGKLKVLYQCYGETKVILAIFCKTGKRRKLEKDKKENLKSSPNTAKMRKDFLHKRSTEIINENQVIVHEDLRLKNMTKSAKGRFKETGRNIVQKSSLNRSRLDLGAFSFF